MDHIPKPSDALPSQVFIPYVPPGELEYDGQGFAGFPERTRINIAELLHGNLQHRTWTESIAFIQQWLWFGVIFEVFSLIQIEFDLKDFVWKGSDGQSIITTRMLPYYLGIWETKTNLTQSDHHNRLEEDICAILRLGRRVVGDLVPKGQFETNALFLQQEQHTPSDPRDSIGDRVLLSIVLLLDAISRCKVQFLGGESPGGEYAPALVFDLLRRAGWCDNEIVVLDQRQSRTELIYLSMFDRKKLKKDHSRCKITDLTMILTWNKERCSANQLDSTTYQTAHSEPGCSCDFISTGSGEGPPVDSILLRDHFPLFRIEDRSDRFCLSVASSNACLISNLFEALTEIIAWMTPRLTGGTGRRHKFVSPSGYVRYVAISHVWSSGLGNPRQNALPICQLKSVQKMVNELYNTTESVPFWIDTLGVPLDTKWRRRAISDMHNVYRNADKVLVLDQSLRIASLNCQPEEAMQRIRISDWAQRLWTLPEGTNPRELYFRFNERSISDIEIVHWYENVRGECGWASQLKRRVACAVCGDGNCCLGPLSPCNKDYDDGMEFMAECGASECLVSQWTNLQKISSMSDAVPPLRAHTGTAIFESAFTAYKEMRDGLFQAAMEGLTIKNIIDAIRWRTTSWTEDETLCLAQLLTLDPKPLLDVKASERMRVLLSQFDSFPSNILFGNRERYAKHGSRWIPTTLLNMGFENVGTSKRMGKSTPEGLLVAMPGARLMPFDLPHSHSNGVLVYLEADEENPSRYYALLRDSRCRDWSIHACQDKAIIFEKRPVDGPNVRAVSALLVTILTTKDGVNYVRIEANLSFGVPPAEDRSKATWGKLDVIVDQSWCCG